MRLVLTEEVGEYYAHYKELHEWGNEAPEHSEGGSFIFFLEITFDEFLEQELMFFYFQKLFFYCFNHFGFFFAIRIKD